LRIWETPQISWLQDMPLHYPGNLQLTYPEPGFEVHVANSQHVQLKSLGVGQEKHFLAVFRAIESALAAVELSYVSLKMNEIKACPITFF
jgi:hypothetical protein